jgi:hypothetical protein
VRYRSFSAYSVGVPCSERDLAAAFFLERSMADEIPSEILSFHPTKSQSKYRN